MSEQKSYLETHPKIWLMIKWAGAIATLAVLDHYVGAEFVKQIIIAVARTFGVEIEGANP